MVMEAPPSPDSVGREFVRQYYTLLNKAPAHLHRFYNNQSSFVHGGLDPPNRETSPMIGQKQIHQKIQQLNFRDCHAKIAQVDAQATLGNGVVVQVTGELSNAGQPMRRFTQTFVLAAQSPKKYYVHNDIFRYQDEIISEEDCEQEVRSDVEDEINQERPALGDMQPINQQPIPPYYSPNAAPIQGTIPQVPPPHHHAQPPHVLPPQPQPTPLPTVNGAMHPDEINVIPSAPVPSHVASTQAAAGMTAPLQALQPSTLQPQPSTLQPQPSSLQPSLPPPLPVVVPVNVDERAQQLQQPIDEGAGDGSVENIYQDEPVQEDLQEVVQEPAAISNEPKTYATLLKSGNVSTYNTSPQIPNIPIQQPPVSPPPSSNHFDSREMTPGQQPTPGLPLGQRNNINRNNNNPRGNQVRPRQDSRGGPGRLSVNEEDGRRSQGNAHGDNYQLFLGNLPHFATEEELREIFAEFGQIVDLRIHSKPNNKAGPPGRVPPNYGFITYETQQGVQNCLAAKPHYFPKNDRYGGQQLNVEEKKTKDRPFGGGGGTGGGRPSGDNNGGPRPRDNGQRRGPGGAGLNRGGGAGGAGIVGGQGNRPNSFNRGGGGGGPPNRGTSNTYNNRR